MCIDLPLETIFGEFMAVLRAAGASCPIVLSSERLLPGVMVCPRSLPQWPIMAPLELLNSPDK